MVLPGHLAGGYLATTALLTIFHPDFSSTQINTLLIIGTLASEFPDIDLLFFNLKHRHDKIDKIGVQNQLRNNSELADTHRNYITHVPLFWLIISLLIIIGGLIFNSGFTKYLGLIIFGGTFSHLILDSIESGIRWFAPFTNKYFSIRKETFSEPVGDRPGSLIQYFHFLQKTYWKLATFWAEIIVTIIALIVLFKSL